jgi:hypothetical protein
MRRRASKRTMCAIQGSAPRAGAQVARALLDARGLQSVRIESTPGMLSDHYDPQSKTLRLSPEVYYTPSLAAAGIAAHETGHALQDAAGYLSAISDCPRRPIERESRSMVVHRRSAAWNELSGLGRGHPIRGADPLHLDYIAGRVRCQRSCTAAAREPGNYSWRTTGRRNWESARGRCLDLRGRRSFVARVISLCCLHCLLDGPPQ